MSEKSTIPLRCIWEHANVTPSTGNQRELANWLHLLEETRDGGCTDYTPNLCMSSLYCSLWCALLEHSCSTYATQLVFYKTLLWQLAAQLSNREDYCFTRGIITLSVLSVWFLLEAPMRIKCAGGAFRCWIKVLMKMSTMVCKSGANKRLKGQKAISAENT